MEEKPLLLLVDDDQVNLLVLEKALQDFCRIRSTSSAFEAIRLVKETPPDLIILDIMMPELSGFDLCRLLKADEHFAEVPIIFLTVLDQPDTELAGLEAGAADYLFKPVQIKLLRQRIKNHLELKRNADLLRLQRDLLARKNEELQAALARVRRLEGIIPICLRCKRIRDDTAVWKQLETYLSEHTDALFSHGYCPACLAEEERRLEAEAGL